MGKPYRAMCTHCFRWVENCHKERISNYRLVHSEPLTIWRPDSTRGGIPRSVQVKEETIALCGDCDKQPWRSLYPETSVIMFMCRHGYDLKVETKQGA